MVGLAWLVGLAAGLTYGSQPAVLLSAALAVAAGVVGRGGSALRLAGFVAAATLLGIWRGGLVLPGLAEGPLTPLRGQVVALRGVVTGSPRCGLTSCLFVLGVEAVEVDGRLEPRQARVQVRTASGADLTYGRTASVRGQLRAPREVVGFPRVELLARDGIHEVMDFPLVRLGPVGDQPGLGRLEALRTALEQRITASLPGPEGQLAAGVLLGRDANLAPELRQQLRLTGTSHILAVTGFNVALVGGAILGLARALVARSWAVPVSGLVVAAYTLLVGAPPSAVRAALMFGSSGLAILVGRLPDPLTNLVLAAGAMAAVDPPVLLDVGFQLSFVATAGLILLGGRFTRPSGGWRGGLVGMLGLTLAVELATLPLILRVFHTVSLVGPLANALIGPALPVLMGGAALVLLAAGVPIVGTVADTAAWWVSHDILLVIGTVASWPLASLPTGSLPVWGVVAAYVCILAPIGLATLGARRRWPHAADWSRLAAAGGVVGLVAVAILTSVGGERGGRLRALFFDAAGDGLTLVETPSGRRALIGAAGSPLAVAALAEQLPLLDRTIDLLVVTRAGERDLDGLIEIARRYPIRFVVQPAATAPRWSGLLAERGIPTETGRPGLLVALDDDTRVEIDGATAGEVDRTPSLNLRILHATLDLRILGGGTLGGGIDPESTTVVRLAPELPLTRDLRAQLAPSAERAAVVGGRGAGAGGAAPAELSLGGGEVIELTSDPEQTYLRRTVCRDGPERCSWP